MEHSPFWLTYRLFTSQYNIFLYKNQCREKSVCPIDKRFFKSLVKVYLVNQLCHFGSYKVYDNNTHKIGRGLEVFNQFWVDRI